MKKALLPSIAITGALFAINLITAKLFGKILFGISSVGGEYVARYGFGVVLEKIYGFTTSNDMNVQTRIGFHFLSLVIGFLLIFLLCVLIQTILRRVKPAA